MASHKLDIRRTPLDAARTALAFAAAERLGLLCRLNRGEPVAPNTIRNVLAKWWCARRHFDQAAAAHAGVQPLNAGDPDLVTDALLAALVRIEGRPAPVSTGYPAVGSFVA